MPRVFLLVESLKGALFSRREPIDCVRAIKMRERNKSPGVRQMVDSCLVFSSAAIHDGREEDFHFGAADSVSAMKSETSSGKKRDRVSLSGSLNRDVIHVSRMNALV